MSAWRDIISGAGRVLRRKSSYRPQSHPSRPRILVIRRNRLGDMLCTLPLLHALKRHFPEAHLTVACDEPGAAVALALKAVDEVIVLHPGANSWLATRRNSRRLREFDWVIAAKGGFDRRLGQLTKRTGAATRIGFEAASKSSSNYYTDPVPPPTDGREHQIETLLRLLKPLGITTTTRLAEQLRLDLTPAAKAFTAEVLLARPFSTARCFVVINISSTAPLRFRPEDFQQIVTRLLAVPNLAIALVATPADQARAQAMAAAASSDRVAAVATPGPLELAALVERAKVLLTPEGGAAHLAAAVGAPAVVLWSEGPFDKWRSRGKDHVFVRPEDDNGPLSVDRVWAALEPLAAGIGARKIQGVQSV